MGVITPRLLFPCLTSGIFELHLIQHNIICLLSYKSFVYPSSAFFSHNSPKSLSSSSSSINVCYPRDDGIVRNKMSFTIYKSTVTDSSWRFLIERLSFSVRLSVRGYKKFYQSIVKINVRTFIWLTTVISASLINLPAI